MTNSKKSIQLLKYLDGKSEKQKLDIIDVCVSMAYDRGAISVITLIKEKGLVTDVKTMDNLQELFGDIGNSVNEQVDKLKDLIK